MRTRFDSATQPLGSRADHLLGWLIRYLDEPRLLLWFGEGADKPHPMCAYRITAHLDRIDELEARGNAPELEDLRVSSPQAIPRPVFEGTLAFAAPGSRNVATSAWRFVGP